MQIQCFLEAARYENFTEAARVLFVTQPALSRQIAVLEQEVGVVLFERKNNKIRLTDAGRELCTRLLPLCEAYRQAIESVRMVADGVSGRLAVGVQEDQNLPPEVEQVLSDQLRQWPALRLAVYQRPHRALYDSFYAGDLDLVYVILPHAEQLDESICVRVIHEYPACLAVHERIPLPAEPISVQALCELTETVPLLFLAPEEISYPGALASPADLMYAEPYLSAHKQFVDSTGTLALYLSAGAGMVIVTPGNRMASQPGVRMARLETDESFRHCLLWKADNANPALRQFLSQLGG